MKLTKGSRHLGFIVGRSTFEVVRLQVGGQLKVFHHLIPDRASFDEIQIGSFGFGIVKDLTQ